MNNQFAVLIENIKKTTGLTQREIALKLDYDEKYLSNLLRGNKKTSGKTLKKVELVFNINQEKAERIEFGEDLHLIANEMRQEIISLKSIVKVLTLELINLKSIVTKDSPVNISLEVQRMIRKETLQRLDELKKESFS